MVFWIVCECRSKLTDGETLEVLPARLRISPLSSVHFARVWSEPSNR
jgi:hypothetical protein